MLRCLMSIISEVSVTDKFKVCYLSWPHIALSSFPFSFLVDLVFTTVSSLNEFSFFADGYTVKEICLFKTKTHLPLSRILHYWKFSLLEINHFCFFLSFRWSWIAWKYTALAEVHQQSPKDFGILSNPFSLINNLMLSIVECKCIMAERQSLLFLHTFLNTVNIASKLDHRNIYSINVTFFCFSIGQIIRYRQIFISTVFIHLTLFTNLETKSEVPPWQERHCWREFLGQLSLLDSSYWKRNKQKKKPVDAVAKLK